VCVFIKKKHVGASSIAASAGFASGFASISAAGFCSIIRRNSVCRCFSRAPSESADANAADRQSRELTLHVVDDVAASALHSSPRS
jgi:hypothetical protein